MYFDNCHTAADCKTEYRKLAKQLHSDKGGSDAAFQEMQAEYQKRLTELLHTSRPNSTEYAVLARHLLELLKLTKPEYYELMRLFGKNPTVTLVSQLICELSPKHTPTVKGIWLLFVSGRYFVQNDGSKVRIIIQYSKYFQLFFR